MGNACLPIISSAFNLGPNSQLRVRPVNAPPTTLPWSAKYGVLGIQSGRGAILPYAQGLANTRIPGIYQRAKSSSCTYSFAVHSRLTPASTKLRGVAPMSSTKTRIKAAFSFAATADHAPHAVLPRTATLKPKHPDAPRAVRLPRRHCLSGDTSAYGNGALLSAKVLWKTADQQ